MGYVYDALNRGGEEGAKPPAGATGTPPGVPAPPRATPAPGGPPEAPTPPAPELQGVEQQARQDALGELEDVQRTVEELTELAQAPAPAPAAAPPMPARTVKAPAQARGRSAAPPPAAPAPASAARRPTGPRGPGAATPEVAHPHVSTWATDDTLAGPLPGMPFGSAPGQFDPDGGVRLDDRLIVAIDPLSVMAEEYRSIRTGILARWQQKRHLVHLITSATPQEGKTITSLNLGMSFAELRARRTIVIEADLRLPQFASLLGLPQGRGFIDVLEEKIDLPQAITRLPGQGLYVMPAGGRAASQAIQLLSSAAIVGTLKRLRQEFDHIIIDTPPVVQLADAGILGALSDDVLMVVRLGKTPQSLVDQAVRTLASYNAPVGGMIATDHHHFRHRQRYRYEYRYYVRRKKNG